MLVQPVNPPATDLTAVAAIQAIDVIPLILEVICRTTGLGFSAVARVTETHWIACAVRDEIAFGLAPGGELVLETTICNEIRQHGRQVVIEDVATDDTFRCHPTPQQYGFRSYISVPITLSDGRFFGTLCAIDPQPARLQTAKVVGMFTLFAQLIAFHLDAQDRMTEMETRVSERTAALRGLTEQLARIREDERTRIARELHDELGQGLTALKLDIATAFKGLDDDSEVRRAATRTALTSMAALTESTLDAVDRIITELRPAVLDALGIGAAAEWLVDQFALRTGIRATCHCDEDPGLSPTAESALFRVLQEALTNVSRHAAATAVSVSLHRGTDGVILTVEDNGCGATESSLMRPTAFGVLGMRERLRALDGSLSLASLASGGTRLVAHCPTPRP
jgi:signal transduction histidine kinase